ncbi:MAG: hypothetical protein JWO33_64 [Caulobacteraceae bacterium]|nr:hypothetical protein [Caulobacteraceae bacterium]
MFSTKTRSKTAAPRPSGSERAAHRVRAIAAMPLTNPFVGAAGATLLLVSSACALVAVAGDPKAGAPSVRIALGLSGPPGWREARPQAGQGALSSDTFTLTDGAEAQAPVEGEAVITLPGPMAGAPLPPAPIAGLTEPAPGGALLPIVATDGRSAFQAYARPFISNGKPKVAMVVGGLGLNPKYTRQAIEQLPAEVTLSFVPYREDLQSWIDLARAHGHEVLLEAPMEPNDYPDNDPGPFTLMAGGQPQETAKRTEWLLSRATGYFGLTNYLGSKFVTSEAGMSAFTQTLKARGVAFVDDGSAAKRGGGIPRASADRIIDDQLAAEAINQRLADLESTAAKRGQALGSGFSYPITLTQVSAWAQGLDQRGFQLAPASALMARR